MSDNSVDLDSKLDAALKHYCAGVLCGEMIAYKQCALFLFRAARDKTFPDDVPIRSSMRIFARYFNRLASSKSSMQERPGSVLKPAMNSRRKAVDG